MTNSSTIIGALVLHLVNEGYRVELCDQDGGGMYLYAEPDGGEKPVDGWNYFVRLVPENTEAVDVVSDYSVNLETTIAPVLALAQAIDAVG
jgi:hypothetical protein